MAGMAPGLPRLAAPKLQRPAGVGQRPDRAVAGPRSAGPGVSASTRPVIPVTMRPTGTPARSKRPRSVRAVAGEQDLAPRGSGQRSRMPGDDRERAGRPPGARRIPPPVSRGQQVPAGGDRVRAPGRGRVAVAGQTGSPPQPTPRRASTRARAAAAAARRCGQVPGAAAAARGQPRVRQPGQRSHLGQARPHRAGPSRMPPGSSGPVSLQRRAGPTRPGGRAGGRSAAPGAQLMARLRVREGAGGRPGQGSVFGGSGLSVHGAAGPRPHHGQLGDGRHPRDVEQPAHQGGVPAVRRTATPVPSPPPGTGAGRRPAPSPAPAEQCRPGPGPGPVPPRPAVDRVEARGGGGDLHAGRGRPGRLRKSVDRPQVSSPGAGGEGGVPRRPGGDTSTPTTPGIGTPGVARGAGRGRPGRGRRGRRARCGRARRSRPGRPPGPRCAVPRPPRRTASAVPGSVSVPPDAG